ncbi:diguanylate cyclase [Telmatospirillum sp. J64-1]|uniref:diguanylate cyclase n=1 Tax=Telmatospirillum sp. J64-1 TaxID=2502183 RepID=UPI00115F342A|nr:diguanylate cyclase [Telmatospirillum sp. J64-1]
MGNHSAVAGSDDAAWRSGEYDDLRTAAQDMIAEMVETITSLWDVVDNADSWSPDMGACIDSLFSAAHCLTGTSGTVGCTQIHQTSAPLESALRQLRNERSLPSPEARAQISLWISELRDIWYKGDASIMLPAKPGKGAEAPPSSDRRVVLLIGKDADPALNRQLTLFGYDVRACPSGAEALAKLAEIKPCAAVMDMGQGGTWDYALAELKQIAGTVPTIAVAAPGGIGDRLTAVRAGCQAYLTKPVDGDDLVQCLDGLTRGDQNIPYRVLIVDDDPVLARSFSLTLRGVGMEVDVLCQPFGILDKLAEFRPDLVLMDVYMPGCTGIELAQVVRQHKEHLGLPIVFLSVEKDLDMGLTAKTLVGDEFLNKPIAPSHLAAHVTSRIRRARQLRAVMDCDSLTGLLNHVRIKDRLSAEIARARRQNTLLSFALIDLDHFKQVNDRLGHLAGDRVIKALSTMLTRRLRASDVIGRYGGEEFAVILPDTPPDRAMEVLDRLRESFGSLHHGSEESGFKVTLSCGVAHWNSGLDVEGFIHAADTALYAAKRSGRNRVAAFSYHASKAELAVP